MSRARKRRFATVAALSLAALSLAAYSRPGRRAVRRLARGLDARIEGFSEPSARGYAHLIAPALGRLYERVADDAAAESGGGVGLRVLDIGCGSGELAVILTERLPGARVVGLDCSPPMIALARRYERADGRLRFEIGDAVELPFEPGTFDIVVSTLSLHHWPDAGAAFAEIGRVLRPGGVALLYDLALLTLEAEAMSEITRRAGLPSATIGRERLPGGILAGLFVRFRIDGPTARSGS